MKLVTLALFISCIVVMFLTLSGCDGSTTYRVKTEVVQLDSIDQIAPLRDSLVKPVLYTNISGLERLPLHETKRKFIAAILPSILVAKHEVHNLKHKVSELAKKRLWDKSDSTFYQEMKKTYNAKNIEDLISRLGTLPTSIVLAQAAIETGWGESRFFVQASNLFGIWSFDDKESRIAAGDRNEKTIFLRSYDDMSGSISDYFEVLAKHHAYRSLRKARLETSDPYTLVNHLKHYSERRTWYTRQLKKVIRQNNLTKYDRYRIDPAYLE